jgi:hypothetical protein
MAGKTASSPAVITSPTVDLITPQVLVLRGQKILLAQQLAALYGVETKALNQGVKRNIKRFPSDFMFQLSRDDVEHLRSQMVTLNEPRHGETQVIRSQFVSLNIAGGRQGTHLKYLPYAFTEQGVAMLSSVLGSDEAIAVNIEIMRAFISLRGMASEHKNHKRQLASLERKYDDQFKVVFTAIRELMSPEPPKKNRPIGFVRDDK